MKDESEQKINALNERIRELNQQIQDGGGKGGRHRGSSSAETAPDRANARAEAPRVRRAWYEFNAFPTWSSQFSGRTFPECPFRLDLARTRTLNRQPSARHSLDGTSGERGTYPSTLPVSRVLLHGDRRLRYCVICVICGFSWGGWAENSKSEIRNSKSLSAL